VALAIGLGAAGMAGAQETPIVNAGTPAPECSVRVNVDRNTDMPGYFADWNGARVCVPFMPTNQLVPADYSGADFYVDEFTDAKARQKWAACKRDTACAEKVMASARGFAKFEPRDTGRVDPAGAIDFEGEVDLKAIRRPAYFGAAPYDEPIAEADARTYVVEFTVPRDSYEIHHLKLGGEIKLRGWYLEGAGVDQGNGGRLRALVIMNNGGGSEITAIDNPQTVPFVLDPATGDYVANKEDKLSEEPGSRHWRGFVHALNAAGFDVLVTDRRGNGISGGRNGYNTAEQANDMFRELAQMDSGDGLRILTPGGEVLSGQAAAGRLLGGQRSSEIPIVIGGYSRGSYATQWAMHKNFVQNCNYDVAEPVCEDPVGLDNIKGAILYGPNSAGLGYRVRGHDQIEGALREEFNTTYYVDSGVLANVDKWPGLQIVKGTWDYVEGLEGSLDAYSRATGLKDISVFLGPHGLATQHPENMRFAGERMVAFARAAVLGQPEVEGAVSPENLKELVTSVPHHWELTTAPGKQE
jgi:hypothetical protein